MRKDWTTEVCKNCGSQLDPFGSCPNAAPEEAVRQAAPVHCGLTPEEATKKAAEILRAA